MDGQTPQGDETRFMTGDIKSFVQGTRAKLLDQLCGHADGILDPCREAGVLVFMFMLIKTYIHFFISLRALVCNVLITSAYFDILIIY